MKSLLIPKNLDLVDKIKVNVYLLETEKKHLLKYIDRVWYFISYLYNASYEDQSNKINFYIPVNYETMASIITSRTFELSVKFLLKEKIILKNNSYFAGEYSKSYKLLDKYLSFNSKRYVLSDVKLINILKKKLTRGFICKKSKYNLCKIKVNFVGALEIIKKIVGEKLGKYIILYNHYTYVPRFSQENYYPKDIEGFFDKLDILISDLYMIKEDMRKIGFKNGLDKIFNEIIYFINHCKYSVLKLEENDFSLNIDRTENRLHTVITNMKREMRNALYLENGKKLVNIDIANSQPFIFNHFLEDLEEDLFETNDIELWKKLTCSGKLYEYLMRVWNISINRNDFKELFFKQVFYSKENRGRYNNMFKNNFPLVYEKIIEMKKENHANLPIKMAQFESNVMIFGVLNKLYTYDEIFALSIHDSIICEEENVDLVKERIYDEFKKYNMKPKLKIEKIN